MGTDLTSLMQIDTSNAANATAVQSRIQHASTELNAFASHLTDKGYALSPTPAAFWVEYQTFQKIPVPRGILDHTKMLVLPQEISIAIGEGVLFLYYCLRVPEFLEDEVLQDRVLAVARRLAILFQATEGIITHDESVMISTFEQGYNYEHCVAELRSSKVAATRFTDWRDFLDPQSHRFRTLHWPLDVHR